MCAQQCTFTSAVGNSSPLLRPHTLTIPVFPPCVVRGPRFEVGFFTHSQAKCSPEVWSTPYHATERLAHVRPQGPSGGFGAFGAIARASAPRTRDAAPRHHCLSHVNGSGTRTMVMMMRTMMVMMMMMMMMVMMMMMMMMMTT